MQRVSGNYRILTAAGALVSSLTHPCHAQAPAQAEQPHILGHVSIGGATLSQPNSEPIVPASYGLQSSGYWVAGAVLERGSSNITGVRSLDETRLGLSLAYRRGPFGPHLRALISPSFADLENAAALLGIGIRAHLNVWGLPLTYGIGAHIEARLRDSLIVSYLTPVEIGTPIYTLGSAEFGIVLGLRRAIRGRLINSFLLDPNGFDNQNSQDRLDQIVEERPWQAFVSVTFGRRLD